MSHCVYWKAPLSLIITLLPNLLEELVEYCSWLLLEELLESEVLLQLSIESLLLSLQLAILLFDLLGLSTTWRCNCAVVDGAVDSSAMTADCRAQTFSMIIKETERTSCSEIWSSTAVACISRITLTGVSWWTSNGNLMWRLWPSQHWSTIRRRKHMVFSSPPIILPSTLKLLSCFFGPRTRAPAAPTSTTSQDLLNWAIISLLEDASTVPLHRLNCEVGKLELQQVLDLYNLYIARSDSEDGCCSSLPQIRAQVTGPMFLKAWGTSGALNTTSHLVQVPRNNYSDTFWGTWTVSSEEGDFWGVIGDDPDCRVFQDHVTGLRVDILRDFLHHCKVCVYSTDSSKNNR